MALTFKRVTGLLFLLFGFCLMSNHWHLVLCSSTQGSISSFSNGSTLPADSSGRAFFFRDYRVFAEAQAWCTATMPRVYFK